MSFFCCVSSTTRLVILFSRKMSDEIREMKARLAKMEQKLLRHNKKKKKKHHRRRSLSGSRSPSRSRDSTRERSDPTRRGKSVPERNKNPSTSTEHSPQRRQRQRPLSFGFPWNYPPEKRRRCEDTSVRRSGEDSAESELGSRPTPDPMPDSPHNDENISPEKNKASGDEDNLPEKTDGLSAAEILEVFGKRLYGERASAPEVLADLAIRWEEVLEKGIPTDVIKEILLKHPPPKNCSRFEPPKLNPVLKAILSEQGLARDNRLMERQEKILAALSAIAKALSTVITVKTIPEWKILAENLSDASKVMADIQHDQSIVRRNLILANVDVSMKDTLKDAKIDELLFGQGLEDAVKNVKTIQTTSKELKKTSGNSTITKNFKAPQRLQQYNKKAIEGGETKEQHYNSSHKQSQHYKTRDYKQSSSKSRRHR